MILPIVIDEIHTNKQDVKNLSTQERYQRFFINFSTKTWTNSAREIIRKYSFVFNSIKTYCYSTVENIKMCLSCLITDMNVIKETFSTNTNPTNLRQIHLPDSDRYRTGQTVLFLVIQNKQKLVYKNCDSLVDQTLERFIELLN